MEILIATGIFPPEIGGPSRYAQELQFSLRRAGHTVEVVTYGRLKKLPIGIRHIAFGIRLISYLMRYKTVIALDTFSVALPLVFLAGFFKTQVYIRTGGDFLWEAYLERSHDLLPLSGFYSHHQPFTRKERMIYALTGYVVRRARMIFSTKLQQDLWCAEYRIAKEHTHIIGNAIEELTPGEPPHEKIFMWNVRSLVFKNLTIVRSAFARVQAKFPDIILDDGIYSHKELLERMKYCYAVLLPSITEISPNFILDAARCHKPFIMTKYCGLEEELQPYGLLVDPLNEDELVVAIKSLLDPRVYEQECEKVSKWSTVRTYDAVARDFIKVIS
ncbi:MAG: glucosyltransferase [Candidatus Kaiserbacteria bacterium]|nr:glucosyltransferase [Candidatus Kaiserbacteria bacterium]